jgi:hypothetical protein
VGIKGRCGSSSHVDRLAEGAGTGCEGSNHRRTGPYLPICSHCGQGGNFTEQLDPSLGGAEHEKGRRRPWGWDPTPKSGPLWRARTAVMLGVNHRVRVVLLVRSRPLSPAALIPFCRSNSTLTPRTSVSGLTGRRSALLFTHRSQG